MTSSARSNSRAMLSARLFKHAGKHDAGLRRIGLATRPRPRHAKIAGNGRDAGALHQRFGDDEPLQRTCSGDARISTASFWSARHTWLATRFRRVGSAPWPHLESGSILITIAPRTSLACNTRGTANEGRWRIVTAAPLQQACDDAGWATRRRAWPSSEPSGAAVNIAPSKCFVAASAAGTGIHTNAGRISARNWCAAVPYKADA